MANPGVRAAMKGAKQAKQSKAKPGGTAPPQSFDAIRKLIVDDDTGRVDLARAKDLLSNPQWFGPIMEIVTGHLVTAGVPDLVIVDMGVQWGREKIGSAFNEASCRADLTKQIGAAKTTGWGANWKQALMRSVDKNGDTGKVLGNATNAVRTLKLAPAWAKCLWLNDFSRQVVYRSPAPWHDPRIQIDPRNPPTFGPNDDLRIADWMQSQGIPVSIEVAGKAAVTVAEDHQFNPVREYLESLKWDGTPRIDRWMATYFGANPNNAIEMEFGKRWLISAVARIYEPGCKADHMLVLDGVQGQGKSTGLRTLMPEGSWFTDHLPDLANKDAMIQIQGRWIIEMSELEAFHGSGVSRIKAYLSRTTEDFRPPYGRGNVRYPRTCVFTGTTNKPEWLQDDTGNRRFWIVSCGPKVNLSALETDRDQLWAEAVRAYRQGQIWWIVDPALQRQAEAVQAERLDVNEAWMSELLASGSELRTRVAYGQPIETRECLVQTLGFKIDRVTKKDEMEMAKCLKRLGFSKRRSNGISRWVPPSSLP